MNYPNYETTQMTEDVYYFCVETVRRDFQDELVKRATTAAQARITALEMALQALVNFDDKNYYQRVHITQEPDVMKQARAALEVKP